MPPKSKKVSKRAIVFGHADGDGYLAAEVSRENLIADGWVVSDVVVDPQHTANYGFWLNHFQEWDFSQLDLVVVVDIAFDFDQPLRSCEALSHHAAQFPRTRFIVIDHHPLSAGGWLPSNVVLHESPSVYACCYGEPNDLMVLASICDKDEEPVKDLISSAHRTLAEGVNRAARSKNGIAGQLLLSMLHNKEWAWFYTLGDEPKEFHRSYYGRRLENSKVSPALNTAMQKSG